MTEPARRAGPPVGNAVQPGGQSSSTNLADILERVLDKGIVIAGDIKVNLLDIELLTIKLRLLVASVDKAKEMGIDWWEHDPSLTSRSTQGADHVESSTPREELEADNAALRDRIDALEKVVGHNALGDGSTTEQPSADNKDAS